MSKFFGSIRAGSTSVSLPVNLGAASGVAYSAVTVQYWRQGGSPVTVVLTPITAIGDVWVSGGWIELTASAIPAVYRLDVPDAAFIVGADWVEIIVSYGSGDAWYVERLSLTAGTSTADLPGDFTYSGNPAASNLDAVRWYIGDTDESDPLMFDAEITFALTLGNALAAAVVCCESIASKFARKCDKTIGDAHLSASQKRVAYESRAAELRAMIANGVTGGLSPFAGGISEVQKQTQEEDTDRVGPYFEREMFSFPGESTTPTAKVTDLNR